MEIRKAETKDINAILNLLKQVNLIHHNGRPDIFNIGTKYTYEQLVEIIDDDNCSILVANDNGKIKGYAFCIYQENKNDNILTDIKTLYLDDLCVDENYRGKHIGKKLYDAVLELAKEKHCYNVTLNVWHLNESALKFYEKVRYETAKNMYGKDYGLNYNL